MATARARASFIFLVCDRAAEYAVARGAGRAFVTRAVARPARCFVAAAAGLRPKQMRLTSARGAIQKLGFLFT
jgi:hypothetical protein